MRSRPDPLLTSHLICLCHEFPWDRFGKGGALEKGNENWGEGGIIPWSGRGTRSEFEF